MSITINKRMIYSFVLAITSTWSLSTMIKANPSFFAIGNSVFAIMLFAILFILYYRIGKYKIDLRLKWVSGIIGCVFSFAMVCGTNILVYQSSLLNQPFEFFKILFGIPIFAIIICWIFLSGLPKLSNLELPTQILKYTSKVFYAKHSVFIIWCLIFVSWIPILLATYPGIYGYDSVYQVWYFQSGNIMLHHPLIHTYLLGFCVSTIGNLFGNRQVGLLVYSIVQMLIVSFGFAFILNYMKKSKVSHLIQLFFLLLFMFLPINPVMALSATKDIIYSATFGIVEVILIQMVTRRHIVNKNKFIMAAIFWIFVNLIFRNQAIYVYVVCVFVSVFLIKADKFRSFSILIVPIILFAVYSGPVTSLLHGQKSDSIREMMSVPCVQLSTVGTYSSEKLSSVELKEIKEYIPNYKTIKNWSANSDSMKKTFNSKLFKENPIAFVKIWVEVGMKSPLQYLDSFMKLTIGMWYPDMNYNDPHAYHPYWEYESTQQNSERTFFIVKETPLKGFHWIHHLYDELAYKNVYQKIPVLSMLFSSGFYAWTLILFIGWAIYVREYKLLFPFSLVFALWLTLLLGPVVLYRYVFPIAFALPAMLVPVLAYYKEAAVNGEDKIYE